jgi:hypothetical protein
LSRAKDRAICLTLVAAVAPFTSCTRESWYRCHYRATVKAADGRSGIPCVAQAVKADEPSRGLLFVETKTKTGSPFHGWMRVVRPEVAGPINVHLVVSCQGYTDVARDFNWNSTPDTCKPGVDVGELRVLPGTPTLWPGSGPSSVQEKIDIP